MTVRNCKVTNLPIYSFGSG